jgi:hypothetical protein
VKRFIAASVFLVTFALFASVIVHFALDAYTESCKAANQTNNHVCAYYDICLFALSKITEFLNAKGVAITAIATVVISLFTWFLVDSTEKLWDAENRKLRQSIDSTERQSRAYVFLNSISFGDEFAFDAQTLNYIKPVVKWMNSGATPAKNVVTCCNCDYPQEQLPNDFDFPDGPVTENFEIGPHASFLSQSLNVSVGNLQRVATHQYNFFIWGWIDYNDVFSNERRRTEFNRQVLVSRGASDQTKYFFSPIASGPFNGSDETCYRKPQPRKKT